MAFKEGVLFTYNDTVQGQIPVSTVTSPWFRTDAGDKGGFSQVTLKGTITQAGGTTTLTVDESFDGVNQAWASADQAGTLSPGPGPASVTVAAPYCRIRIVQTTAGTASFKLSAKSSD